MLYNLKDKRDIKLSACTFPVQYVSERIDITDFLEQQFEKIQKAIQKTVHQGEKEVEHKGVKRPNNPKAGMARYDRVMEKWRNTPQLQWVGKAEHTSFEVPTSSIHIHESIKPHKILHAVQAGK